MTNDKLSKLWEQVVHIGTVDNFDDDRMLALGSVFGELREEIEKLQKESELSQKLIEQVSSIMSLPYSKAIWEQGKTLKRIDELLRIYWEDSK